MFLNWREPIRTRFEPRTFVLQGNSAANCITKQTQKHSSISLFHASGMLHASLQQEIIHPVPGRRAVIYAEDTHWLEKWCKPISFFETLRYFCVCVYRPCWQAHTPNCAVFFSELNESHVQFQLQPLRGWMCVGLMDRPLSSLRLVKTCPVTLTKSEYHWTVAQLIKCNAPCMSHRETFPSIYLCWFSAYSWLRIFHPTQKVIRSFQQECIFHFIEYGCVLVVVVILLLLLMRVTVFFVLSWWPPSDREDYCSCLSTEPVCIQFLWCRIQRERYTKLCDWTDTWSIRLRPVCWLTVSLMGPAGSSV